MTFPVRLFYYVDVLAGELVRTLVAVTRRARTNDALCTAYTVPYVHPDDGG